MTTPTERTRAVRRMERIVWEISRITRWQDGATFTLPRDVVHRLIMTTRHYPTRYDLERSHEALPDVWGPPEGDV